MDKQLEWDIHFLEIAKLIAKKSKDNSLGVGCVIVGPNHEIRTTGYNGFPRKIEYSDVRMVRPEKYFWIEHAERNAIYNAARCGIGLEGCTAYVACTDLERGGNAPCIDCARAFVQVGIVEVVEYKTGTPTQEKDRKWAETTERSMNMFKEAGIVIRHTEI